MSWVYFFLARISICESSLFQCAQNLILVILVPKNPSGCCWWDIQLQLWTCWVDRRPPWKCCSCISSIGNFCITQMSSFSLTSCFFARGDKKKTDYWKGKMTKGFQWGDRKAKFLQKMKMTRQSFLLLIYFWLNMTERLSWGKELLLTADNIATPYLHTTSTLYK